MRVLLFWGTGKEEKKINPSRRGQSFDDWNLGQGQKVKKTEGTPLVHVSAAVSALRSNHRRVKEKSNIGSRP